MVIQTGRIKQALYKVALGQNRDSNMTRGNVGMGSEELLDSLSVECQLLFNGKRAARLLSLDNPGVTKGFESFKVLQEICELLDHLLFLVVS